MNIARSSSLPFSAVAITEPFTIPTSPYKQTHVEFVEFGVPIFRLRVSDHPIDMLLLIQEKVDRNDMNEIRSQNTV